MGTWGDLLERWTKQRRPRDLRALERTAGHVAVLPTRQPSRRRRWALLAVAALAFVLALAVLFLQPAALALP